MNRLKYLIFGSLFVVFTNNSFAQEAITTPVETKEIIPVSPVPEITSGSDRLRLGTKPNITPEFELPNVTGLPNSLPQSPIINAPVRKPTKEEIARDIAPNFNINRDYNRLVTCYGTADYMAAFTKVRANRAGSPPGLKIMAEQVAGLKYQMQPMVLVASSYKTEAKFRTDYDKTARSVQNRISAATNPDPIFQSQLKLLNSCQADLKKWRGGK